MNYFSRERQSASGWWKVFGILGIAFGLVMTVISACLQEKNRKYRDALIAISDQLPEEEDAKMRRAAWRSSQAPANRVTTEERLENNRGQEE